MLYKLYQHYLYAIGIISVAVSGQYYHVYKQDWKERECSHLLSRARHRPIEVPMPPKLTGEWTSYRCEIRPGPEYVLRKYRFHGDASFDVHQYFYSDPECSHALYAIVAEGTYKLLKESWVVTGGTEAKYQVAGVHFIPYTTDMRDNLKSVLTKTCPDLLQDSIESYRKYQILNYSFNKHGKRKNNKKHATADFDCTRLFNFTLNELQLVRLETSRHFHLKHQNEVHIDHLANYHELKTLRELFLGDIHTSVRHRQTHRPTSYQPALRRAETDGCHVCSQISNSNDFYPPELKRHHGMPVDLHGDWVSSRCESRQFGQFVTRWLTFLPDGKSWQGQYDFYHDSHCTDPTFTLQAKGTYVGGDASEIIPGAENYNFRIIRLKVTPRDYRTVENLNFYKGSKCGIPNSWKIGVEQDVSSTNGCLTLGLQLPNVEYEILKMGIEHRKVFLYVGQRPSDGGSMRTRERRPTSFQEPLIKCETSSVAPSYITHNAVYERQQMLHSNGQSVRAPFLTLISLMLLIRFR